MNITNHYEFINFKDKKNTRLLLYYRRINVFTYEIYFVAVSKKKFTVRLFTSLFLRKNYAAEFDFTYESEKYSFSLSKMKSFVELTAKHNTYHDDYAIAYYFITTTNPLTIRRELEQMLETAEVYIHSEDEIPATSIFDRIASNVRNAAAKTLYSTTSVFSKILDIITLALLAVFAFFAYKTINEILEKK